ncbi:excinuclease ABC subunit UvrA [Desulforegula conservatrix]|uniref:excinuclease ABC subunit UvrA n=1 Tax=Desulforegula conservatrix TaxID=153026 RepID=UPI0003FD4CE4|nr:excinuclease ABC subunit UvrA [Desulforegula conservatrix]
MSSDSIHVRGARQHNLKNIDVQIPRNKLVVITGLSGSGKSTLAFDTLYAEGQRRYVESLSTYARQFLGQMDKPDVDSIEGLSPAIAIEQKTAGHNPRSTVGTITEIYDYIRLLFARTGVPHCHVCGKIIQSQSLDQIVDQVMGMEEGTRIFILSPVAKLQKGTHEKLFTTIRKGGFARVRVNGEIFDIEEVPVLDKNKKHTIEIVVDRLVVKPEIRTRLADSIELSISNSGGNAVIETASGEAFFFSENAACRDCGISYPEFTPASFSFNSPHGACTACDGLGSTTEFDPGLIIPDRDLSLRDGAVTPWSGRSSVQFTEFLDALTNHYGIDIYTPVNKLPEKFLNVLLYGSGAEEIPFYFERDGQKIVYKKNFEGVIPNLKRRYKETNSAWMREEISQYMNFIPCTSCTGTRLNPAARNVRVSGLTVPEMTSHSVEKCLDWFMDLKLEGKNKVISEPIVKEITDRLSFLKNVGLNYLTLNRTASTLSGGESQRIRLATQIGSRLTGVMYVLDEPSIGLHQRDNQRLITTLKNMRDLGNTVIVVEHDSETITESDYVIDMGPGAGVHGGEVVFAGTPAQLIEDEKSLTALYMSGKEEIRIPEKRRTSKKHIILKGASENNLKNVTAEFPIACLTCVTGVSGSGKSTLILETLNKLLARKFSESRAAAGANKGIEGLEHIDKVVHIDQSPIGRTPRSNPGTYTGIFSFIRELFAQTQEAKARGYKLGRFSFNVKGGRCESCQGDGIIKIEMHFLPDVYVACDVCKGKRYNRETLEIHYKGKNISDVLNMTVDQAADFFTNIPSIKIKLQTLQDVGLGYIRIGQAATTLSGGEAQRIKLARELSKRSTGRTIYILDEPTTGLHMDDIRKLLDVLDRLVESGNTMIVIEHNLDVIKFADYIVDLGPEGGDGGGEIIATGTPEEVAENEKSHTGKFLKQILHNAI